MKITLHDKKYPFISKGKDAEDALRKLKQEYRWIKDYEFDRLVAREVREAIYL